MASGGRLENEYGDTFVANRRFDPSADESWKHYIARSGLIQLREFISLDEILFSTAGEGYVNLLAVLQNPSARHIESVKLPGFRFAGRCLWKRRARSASVGDSTRCSPVTAQLTWIAQCSC